MRDALFNEYTDLAYEYLKAQRGNVIIYISATAKVYFRWMRQEEMVTASTAPLMISCGALSPPIASTTTFVISFILLPPSITKPILLDMTVKINNI